MSSEQKRHNLTFSQWEGKAPLPEALEAGNITRKFRNRLWLAVDSSVSRCILSGSYTGAFDRSSEAEYWSKCIIFYYVDVLNQRHSHAPRGPSDISYFLQRLIINEEPHIVITLCEHMLRTSGIPNRLEKSIEDDIEGYTCYYINRAVEPVRVMHVSSVRMRENTKRSLDNINESDLIGTKLCLSNAARELNGKNFAGSIRESIHAVESAVRQIDPESSKDFGKAMDSLEKNKTLKHQALRDAFKKLYGYTSDEQGIRHPLIDSDEANVGFDEAIFMYGACVSFVDYLASKQKQLNEK